VVVALLLGEVVAPGLEPAPEVEPERLEAVEDPDPVAVVEGAGPVAALGSEPVLVLPAPGDVALPVVVDAPLEDAGAWAGDPVLAPHDVGPVEVVEVGELAVLPAGAVPPAVSVGAALPEVEL
jgi:hypothetical protein